MRIGIQSNRPTFRRQASGGYRLLIGCCCDGGGNCCGVTRLNCDPFNPEAEVCCAMGKRYRVTVSGQVSTVHEWPDHIATGQNGRFFREALSGTTSMTVNATALVSCDGDTQTLSEVQGSITLARNYVYRIRNLDAQCEPTGEFQIINESYSFTYTDAEVLQILGTAMMQGYGDAFTLLQLMATWRGLPTPFPPGSIINSCGGSTSFTPDAPPGCPDLAPTVSTWSGENGCQRRTANLSGSYPIDGFYSCDQPCLQTVGTQISQGAMTIDIVTLEPCDTNPCGEGLRGTDPARFAGGTPLAGGSGCSGCGGDGL